ncbi:MAG: efflux transporter outer membrane subunit [Rhodocyclaceae bacterium]
MTHRTMLKRRLPRVPLLLASLLVMAGCSLAPTYERPDVAAPGAFKESLDPAQQAKWKVAQPSEAVARGQWWTIFGDATLNGLEDQALAANQDLRAAAARVAQSRALLGTARSDQYPQVGAAFGPTRQRASAAAQGVAPDDAAGPSTLWRAQVGIAYEVNLFGRVANSVSAARADTEQSEALFESVRLALQADVAQAHFLVRQLDAEQEIYVGTVALREQTLKLVQRRFDEGDISELDVARARTELASAQSESMSIARRRAAAEHALATLLGSAPAAFSLPAQPLTRVSVIVPAGLPSALLERRPDVAAAERAMAAANARIGVARSAFFPSLAITGAAGYESAQLSDLFEWSSRAFLIGPLAGAMLSMPIFDGGRRQAGVNRAHAVYEEDVARYRQTVLNAFREVEDSLANLRILADQTEAQDTAVNASSRAAQLSHFQYREGSISYLDVIDADRSVLTQKRVSVLLDGERARSAVDLIRAMGGGWSPAAVSDARNPGDIRLAVGSTR